LPPPPPDDDGDKNSWGDFLNPKEESEDLRRAREYMSEQSLALSFEEDDETEGESKEDESNENKSSSAIIGPVGFGRGPILDAPSAEALANNPYMQVVSKLSPSELISKFTATANPRVQGAVRNTILGLIGSLPKMAFDTTTITTGQRLASLMFQLQMTGYMFKNADYRLSLSQSLGGETGSSPRRLKGSKEKGGDVDDFPVNGNVNGKLKLKYGGVSNAGKINQRESSGREIEVDAAAYMSELRSEVKKLRDELTRTQQAKEEEIRKDLLLYIRTMPEEELRSLTSTMSPDVLMSMKGLVNAVMSGLGEGEITASTVTEQSGEAMAQLCMWQLVVGYNLRELEVREEMKKSLMGGSKGDTDSGGVPGSFE